MNQSGVVRLIVLLFKNRRIFSPTDFTLLAPVPKGATDQWVKWKLAFTIASSSCLAVCWKNKVSWQKRVIKCI